MSWKDRVKIPAKFRDVEFLIDTSELSSGRRAVMHEYPFKNEAPYAEDMGRRGRVFPVEGFVIGSDYLATRDAFITALEEEGPGELVHPYYGPLRVVVASFRVRESRNEGGWAQFSIEFKETVAEPSKPTTSIDAPARAVTSAATAKAASGQEFLAKFTVLTTFKDSVVGALRSASAAVNGVLATSGAAAQEVASVTKRITDLTANAAALADTPDALLASLTDLFEATSAALATSAQLLNPSGKLLSLFSFDPGTRPPSTTPNRLTEQVNFDATQHLIQRLALIESVLAAVSQTFESYDDAVNVRLAITDALDAHVDAVADDTYPSLEQLRADLIEAVPGDSKDLPHLIEYTPRVQVPSLVVAHTLYGNLDREEDIIQRNKLSAPGFIPARVALEVLSE